MANEVAIIRIVGGSGGGGSGSGKESFTKTLNSMGIPSMTGMASQLGIKEMLPQFKAAASEATKAMSVALKGLLSATGIGSLIVIVVQIASQFKMLISIIEGILKLIGFLLKPISDVIGVLLAPLLFMLKPIVQAVNQVMAPFLKDAMKLMAIAGKEMAGGNISAGTSTMGAATGIIFAGLGQVLIRVLFDIFKFVLAMVFDQIISIWDNLLAPVFKLFNFAIANVIGMIPIFGEDAKKKFLAEANGGVDAIHNGLVIAKESALTLVDESFLLMQKNSIDGADKITSTFTGMWDNLQKIAAEKARAVETAARGHGTVSMSPIPVGTPSDAVFTPSTGQYKPNPFAGLIANAPRYLGGN